jgi:hypothetical protein
MTMSAYRGRSGARRTLRDLAAVAAASALLAAGLAVVASAAPGSTTVSGVLTPLGGVWLDSADGGHYWDVNGNGICRLDNTAGGPTERRTTCDKQVKKPTQAVVGPENADGTYYLYVADMSATSIGPMREVFDPAADNGRGAIVPNSATVIGGVDFLAFFTNGQQAPPGEPPGEAGGNGSLRSSSVALGPCSATITTPCLALYVGYDRTKKIDRINFVDQPLQDQSIETISVAKPRLKPVRFGIADFHNADGTDDLYIDELGGVGVSVLKDVADCTPSVGSPVPGTTDPPVDDQGGCKGSVVQGITTNFAQGIAVQNNADGTGRYLYVGDSPGYTTPTILRYRPATGLQDVVSTTVTPYDSLQNPGETVSTYTAIGGLAVDPHNGDLYIADDPTLLNELAAETAVGHIFHIAGDGTQTAPADCTGSATTVCAPPQPPGTVTATLLAYGVTLPQGGLTVLPSDDGGHVWLADKANGLCRFDQVSQLRAVNDSACDETKLLGSGGQAAYDDSIVPDTTNDHYVYVAQNKHLKPGVVRFTYDPSADGGAGGLVAGSGVVMAPNAALDGNMADGLALGACIASAPSTCRHSLYIAGLKDGFIRRIDNPEDDPGSQSVDTVAETVAQRNGNSGKGVNGSIGMLGDTLYLPENQGFTVLRNASTCGVHSVLCATAGLKLGATFGSLPGSAIAVDSNPLHSAQGLVYAASSPGAARATIYQYDVATSTARLYTDVGQIPPADTAAATPYCSLTCTRSGDPDDAPGTEVWFRYVQGLFVNPYSNDDTLYITEDPSQGTEPQQGHIWTAAFSPFP